METKFCNKCKETKSTNDFHKNPTKPDGLQSMCKECRKLYHKNHYNLNKETYRKQAKNFMNGIKEWFINIKKELKCSKCGEDRWWVLDFHHTNPKMKDNDVRTLVQRGNKKKILEEIDKCEVYCANCHRDFHHFNKQE
jgi:hypothetical protein